VSVGFEVFTAVVMKRSVFWGITPCSPLKVKEALLSTCFHATFLLGYSSTLKIEAICWSETFSDFQRTTWRYIPEDRSFQLISCFVKLGGREH
jgi:hypothetical protein